MTEQEKRVGILGILEDIISFRYLVLYWSFALYADIFFLIRYHEAFKNVDISSINKLNIIGAIYFIFGLGLIYSAIVIIDVPLRYLVYTAKDLLDWIRNLSDKIFEFIINFKYKNNKDDSSNSYHRSNQSTSNNSAESQIFKKAKKITFILSAIDYYLSFKFQTKSLLSSIFKLIPHYYNIISIIYFIIISLMLWDSYN